MDKVIEKLREKLYENKIVTKEMGYISLTSCTNCVIQGENYGNYFICRNYLGEEALIYAKYYIDENNEIVFDIIQVTSEFKKRTIDPKSFSAFFYKTPDNEKFVTEVIQELNPTRTIVTEYKVRPAISTEKYMLEPVNGSFIKTDLKHIKCTITLKYDDIVELDNRAFLVIKDDNNYVDYSVVAVKKGRFWGAYCQIDDHQIVKLRRCNYKQHYLKTRFVPTVFDNIDVLYINEKTRKIYLLVYLDGKVGLLDAFDYHFIIPIVFDSIEVDPSNERYIVEYKGLKYPYRKELMEAFNIEPSNNYKTARTKYYRLSKGKRKYKYMEE